MSKLRTQSARDRLLRKMRKQRLKSITVLPSLVTILNGVCGFAGIVFAGKGQFHGNAVYGKTARKTVEFYV